MSIGVQTRKSPATIRILLEGAVDYAGLFPPATLSLEKAIQNYSAYRSDTNAWMLGRFILPAARLPELSALLQSTAKNTSSWRISVLAGKDFESDMEHITRFNRDAGQYGYVDSIELAPELHNRIESFPAEILRGFTVYFELPLAASTDLLKLIAGKGARAKARTGGVKPGTIPSVLHLAEFIVNCANAGIKFKATAGLHHSIRSIHPLAYESNAPTGEMHGFLNLLVATAFAMVEESTDLVREILSDTNASSFQFSDSEVRWKQRSISVAMLHETRRRLFTAFGSCSFDEPVEELVSLGWL